MEFGVQFFPAVGPSEKSAEAYWNESLDLCELCDELGYSNIRTVEHHFTAYGGYSPAPMMFLAAAAQRSRRARLIVGALLPAFNHPLRIAGEIGMLDAISRGRLEVGFARAFLPVEFEAFAVSLDESRARFNEGVEQVRQLLEGEGISSEGRFHKFKKVTSLPRPTQRPRPPFWMATSSTPESFENAGRLGHGIMITPTVGPWIGELVGLYRRAWRQAGHVGVGRVMAAFFMYCGTDRQAVYDFTRGPLTSYIRSLSDATASWGMGISSKDYPGYDKMAAEIKRQTFESTIETKTSFVGTPADIRAMLEYWNEQLGGLDIASLQVNFHDLSKERAAASMRLFASEVMPHFR